MFGKWREKSVKAGILVVLTLVLAACGRDVSTVEDALEGTWDMADASINGQPLMEVLVENAMWFDVEEDEIPTDGEGNIDYDLQFYYDDGLLTAVDSEGEVRQSPYEILASDEENNRLQIEYALEEEGLVLVLLEDITFIGEEREQKQSVVNIVDIQMESTSQAGTEMEQQWEQFGQEVVSELIKSIELTVDFDYVSEEAPSEIQE